MSYRSEITEKFRKQRPRFELNAVENICSGLLDDLEEYIRFSSGSVDEELQRLSALAEKDTEGMSEEEKEAYYEWRSEDYWITETTIRQLANRSIVVMIYSSLESIYSSYANLLRRNLNIITELSDIKGQGINQIKIYFKKVLGINLTEQSALWQKINALRLVRNDIVHNQSHAYSLVDLDKWKEIWTTSHNNIPHNKLENKQCIAAIKDSYIKKPSPKGSIHYSFRRFAPCRINNNARSPSEVFIRCQGNAFLVTLNSRGIH